MRSSPTSASRRGLTEYYRRLRDEPGCVYNLYFAYMLTLCAIRDCRERLDTCSYLGDDAVAPLMRSLTGHELLRDANVQQQAMTLRERNLGGGKFSVEVQNAHAGPEAHHGMR